MAEVHHRLTAGLLKANRSADLGCQHTEDQFFGIAANLGAEPSADVRGENVHLVVLDTVGGGDWTDGSLRVLGAQPLMQAPLMPDGSSGARFKWTGRNALVEGLGRHDDLTVGEIVSARGGASPEHHGVEDGIRACCFVDKGV